MGLIQDILPVFGTDDCVAGIVISVKILGLKFRPYIADIQSMDNDKISRECNESAGLAC